jgi:hypothetical protein
MRRRYDRGKGDTGRVILRILQTLNLSIFENYE